MTPAHLLRLKGCFHHLIAQIRQSSQSECASNILLPGSRGLPQCPEWTCRLLWLARCDHAIVVHVHGQRSALPSRRRRHKCSCVKNNKSYFTGSVCIWASVLWVRLCCVLTLVCSRQPLLCALGRHAQLQSCLRGPARVHMHANHAIRAACRGRKSHSEALDVNSREPGWEHVPNAICFLNCVGPYVWNHVYMASGSLAIAGTARECL